MHTHNEVLFSLKKRFLTFATTGMNQWNMVQNEVSRHRKKEKACMNSLICRI